MREEVRNVEIEGRAYLGQRVTDEVTKIGFIELWDPATGDPVARVTHDGNDKSTRLATFGHALGRPVIEELFRISDIALG